MEFSSQAQVTGDSAIKSLPVELLAEVLARVASASFTDIFNAKLCCRDFLGATEDNYILQHVSIEKFPVIHQWLKREEVGLFLNRCKESGNPEALYRQGMTDYFSWRRMESGLEQLKRAAEKGHVEASYAYGIILLCMGGKSSIQGLRILNGILIGGSSKSSESRIQECRERTKAVIRTMWINNSIARQQTDFCCHAKTNMRVRETWEGPEYENNGSICDACKWEREVKLFCNMLSGGSFD